MARTECYYRDMMKIVLNHNEVNDQTCRAMDRVVEEEEITASLAVTIMDTMVANKDKPAMTMDRRRMAMTSILNRHMMEDILNSSTVVAMNKEHLPTKISMRSSHRPMANNMIMGAIHRRNSSIPTNSTHKEEVSMIRMEIRATIRISIRRNSSTTNTAVKITDYRLKATILPNSTIKEEAHPRPSRIHKEAHLFLSNLIIKEDHRLLCRTVKEERRRRLRTNSREVTRLQQGRSRSTLQRMVLLVDLPKGEIAVAAVVLLRKGVEEVVVDEVLAQVSTIATVVVNGLTSLRSFFRKERIFLCANKIHLLF